SIINFSIITKTLLINQYKANPKGAINAINTDISGIIYIMFLFIASIASNSLGSFCTFELLPSVIAFLSFFFLEFITLFIFIDKTEEITYNNGIIYTVQSFKLLLGTLLKSNP